MLRFLFKINFLLAIAVLMRSIANAQQSPQPEVSKPIAYRGSFDAKVDDKGNLVITPIVSVPVSKVHQGTRNVCKTVTEPKEEIYTIEVGGKKEQRTRTVNVSRQVCEEVPYTYTTTVCEAELREALINPKVFQVWTPFTKEVRGDIAKELTAAFGNATDASRPQCLFVKTTEEAEQVHQLIMEANQLIARAGGGGSAFRYIVVQNETFDYANSLKTRNAEKMATEEMSNSRPSPPSDFSSKVEMAWPLPTDKSAWIGSLPFTQKTLNGKAMVLWFFEEGCPKCKAKWRDLNSLPLSYKGKPVVFVAVNSGNSPEAVADYVKQNKVNLAVIADTDRQLEKLGDFGEITLENIYQVAIMTPDGQLHRADANDLKATSDAAIKLVK